MTESEIQKEIMAYLKVKDCMMFRMNSGYVKRNIKLSPPGTPDLLVITYNNYLFWLEIKTENGHLRDSQIIMHTKLKDYGQHVYIVRSLEDVQKIIK